MPICRDVSQISPPIRIVLASADRVPRRLHALPASQADATPAPTPATPAGNVNTGPPAQTGFGKAVESAKSAAAATDAASAEVRRGLAAAGSDSTGTQSTTGAATGTATAPREDAARDPRRPPKASRPPAAGAQGRRPPQGPRAAVLEPQGRPTTSSSARRSRRSTAIHGDVFVNAAPICEGRALRDDHQRRRRRAGPDRRDRRPQAALHATSSATSTRVAIDQAVVDALRSSGACSQTAYLQARQQGLRASRRPRLRPRCRRPDRPGEKARARPLAVDRFERASCTTLRVDAGAGRACAASDKRSSPTRRDAGLPALAGARARQASRHPAATRNRRRLARLATQPRARPKLQRTAAKQRLASLPQPSRHCLESALVDRERLAEHLDRAHGARSTASPGAAHGRAGGAALRRPDPRLGARRRRPRRRGGLRRRGLRRADRRRLGRRRRSWTASRCSTPRASARARSPTSSAGCRPASCTPPTWPPTRCTARSARPARAAPRWRAEPAARWWR